MIKEIKEIRLEKMYGTFYVSQDDFDIDYYKIYDEEMHFITNFTAKDEAKLKQTLFELENICNISDLTDSLGVCRSIVWGGNLKELYKEFLEAIGEDEESYSYSLFVDNMPINSIGNKSIYFIVDLEDI